MATAIRIGRKRKLFLFVAPDANEVSVAGTFNHWDPSANPLKKRRDGTWTVVVYLPPGNHEYRIVAEGIWTDDPYCLTRRTNQYGGKNCVIEST